MNKAPGVKADSGLFFMKITDTVTQLMRWNQMNNQEFCKYKILFM